MRTLLKHVERIAVVVGVLFAFFTVLEVIRAYETLSGLHPWAGYALLVLLAGLLAYLVYQVRPFFQLGHAPHPPEIPPEGAISAKTAAKVQRYLQRVADRMEQNSLLGSSAENELRELRQRAEKLSGMRTTHDDFRNAVDSIEREVIAPLLVRLDKTAEAVVSDSVGIVSLGTALSPYRSVDLVIVLMRNFRMVNRILRIYRTRPTLRETAGVFYDIARVVAAVNLLNAMDQLWTGFGRHFPLIGKYGEAVSEGLFSGLLTSVAGHAAIDRCRSYRPWSPDAAARKYRNRLHRWGDDVLSILKRHGIKRIFHRGKASADEQSGDTLFEPAIGEEE